MTSRVRIVDYGIGNLHSVARAFATWSRDVKVVSSWEEIPGATHLVLPGVGAFGAAMKQIEDRGFTQVLRDYADSGRPMIGLCVGMQILATTGQEDGSHMGLDLIKGTVTPLRARDPEAIVPNMGWRVVSGTNIGSPLFDSGSQDSLYYFAHSFEFTATNQDEVAATTTFGDVEIVAAVRKGSLWGLQFHPEKSAQGGLALIRKFLEDK